MNRTFFSISRGPALLTLNLLLLVAFTLAQSVGASADDNFTIKSSVIAGGGGSSTGGALAIDGTIGQAMVGISSAGNFSVAGGFWNTLTQIPAVSNSISGTISYCIDNSKKVPNATVQTTSGSPSASTTTNASGFYQLDNLGTGPYTVAPSKTGAVSGISAQDIGILRRLAAGIDTPTPCQSIAGDTDNNGSLGAQDIGFLRRFVAQLTTTGITGSWKFSPASKTYLSLVSNQTNQDYDALLIGDVDGNWTPAAPDPASFQKSQAPSATNLALSLPSVVAPPGSTDVSIPVMVNGTLTNGDFVLGYTIEISFDPSVLVPHSPSFNTTGTVSSTGVVTENTGVSGRLRLVVDFQNPLIFTGQQTLIILRFDVVGTQGQMSGLNWFFTEFGSGPPAVTTTTTNGNFTVTSPTAVKVDAFKATGFDKGVYLQWQTGFESTNLGFNIYRQQAGKLSLVTPEILAGSALLTGDTPLLAGRKYSWWDNSPDSKQDALYYLEDIDLNGTRSLHGPIVATRASGNPPAGSRAELLSRMGRGKATISDYVASSSPGSAQLATVSSKKGLQNSRRETVPVDLATSSAIKMWIGNSGLYRLTQPQLLSAGLDSGIDPRLLQMYVDGQEVPILVTGQDDGRFDAADTVEFYASAIDSPFTSKRVYWLVAGTVAGRRITKVTSPGKGQSNASFTSTLERRDKTIYFSSLRNGDEENFFGPVIASQEVDQSIDVKDMAAGGGTGAVLEVGLQGVSAVNHRVKVRLNGTELGEVNYSGQGAGVGRFTLSSGQLVEGRNDIKMEGVGTGGDVSLAEYVRVSYERRYKAEGDELRFRAEGGQEVKIGGFTSERIRVFDVTEEGNVVEIGGAIEESGNGYEIGIKVGGAGEREMMAIEEGEVREVGEMRKNEASKLRATSQGADLLIITTGEMGGSLEGLKALRQSQGMAVAIVKVEDIYDEFSQGEKTPYAIREFLIYAKRNWKRKPGYVLMGGDASYDPKNYLGAGEWDLVPTKLVDTAYLETASDEWMVDEDGDGIGEMAIGRLPIRSEEEGMRMVGKIMSYERGVSRRSVLLVSDANDGYNFEQANEELKGMIPKGTRIEEVKRGQMSEEEARARVIGGINEGQAIVSYAGHGSVDIWRGEILRSEDGEIMRNGNQLSVFLMMTCLNGYFEDPMLESLGEAMMKAERGGAVAVWGSSGMCEAGEQAAVSKEMMRELNSVEGLTKKKVTIGEAARRAKGRIGDVDVRRTYVLLGDPTMRLR